MSVEEFNQERLYKIVKDRMDEIGLDYTEVQVNQMADFVNGIVMLTQEIQKACIISKIKEMK